jgi:hypothetical protein
VHYLKYNNNNNNNNCFKEKIRTLDELAPEARIFMSKQIICTAIAVLCSSFN